MLATILTIDHGPWVYHKFVTHDQVVHVRKLHTYHDQPHADTKVTVKYSFHGEGRLIFVILSLFPSSLSFLYRVVMIINWIAFIVFPPPPTPLKKAKL